MEAGDREEILNSVRRIHQLGIVHRDLSPDNMLRVDRGAWNEVVIFDFGVSRTREGMTEELDLLVVSDIECVEKMF